MANENQAQADADNQTTVADPLDTANSQDGTNQAFDQFSEEVQAALSKPPVTKDQESDEQGDEPAYDDDGTQDEPEEVEEQTEQDPEEDTEEQEPEPGAKAKDRFRFKDPLDQKVAAVAKAMGVSLVEAAKIVEGQTATKHQGEDQNQEAVETSAAVTDEIKGLQAQKREKLAALEFEEAADLDDQIEALRDKRENLKIAEVQEKTRTQAEAERKFYADYAKSEDKTVALYPDAGKPDSQMAKEMIRLEAEMQELGDPLYFSADKPFILAKEAAKNLGIPMKKPGTAPVKKTVQHRPIQPAGGNARTTTTDPAKRTSDVIAGLKTTDDFEELVAGFR
jgi:hypothetical protein